MSMDEEQIAYRVLDVVSALIKSGRGDEAKLVKQLWADRQYLLLRCKVIAEGLEDEKFGSKGGNYRDEIAGWAREAYEEAKESI